MQVVKDPALSLLAQVAAEVQVQSLAWEFPYAQREIPPPEKKKERKRKTCLPMSCGEKGFLLEGFGEILNLSLRAYLHTKGSEKLCRQQARGRIGAVATGLHHSHSNAGSEPHLRPTP